MGNAVACSSCGLTRRCLCRSCAYPNERVEEQFTQARAEGYAAGLEAAAKLVESDVDLPWGNVTPGGAQGLLDQAAYQIRQKARALAGSAKAERSCTCIYRGRDRWQETPGCPVHAPAPCRGCGKTPCDEAQHPDSDHFAQPPPDVAKVLDILEGASAMEIDFGLRNRIRAALKGSS